MIATVIVRLLDFILNMNDEDSWNPPWDCDNDADEQIDLSSPFRDSDKKSRSFQFIPVKGHPDFKTAKKHLKFNEVEEEMEKMHQESDNDIPFSKNPKLENEGKHQHKKVGYYNKFIHD